MAFVLSAQLNLLPPSNVAIIAGQIRRQLNNVSVGVSLIAPTNTKAIVTQINNDLQKINKNIKVNVNAKALATGTAHIKQATAATNKLSSGVESLGYQAAKSIKHYAAFALTTSSVIKLTAAFAAGVGDAIKYDRELVRVAQVTGQSLDSLKGLSKEVTRLSTSFGVSSEKILESAVTLSQAGLSAKDTKIALEALAKTGLSATFGDIANTTEAAIAIMQQFGYEAKDLEGIMGSVNAVSAAFAVESDDIAVAVRRSGGALKAAGVNFHEFGALLTSVRQTTRESAESIATGFRTIFARLQRSRTQDFLKNLGIDVLNDDGLFVGGYEAIGRISAALKEISTVDPRFSQIVEELGGFRQISKVIPLIEQFEVAEKALKVSLRGGNSLTKDAVVAQQSLEVQFTKTREAFLALIRDIIQDDGFKNVVKGILSIANAFIKVGDSIRPLIPLIAIVGGVSLSNKIGPFRSGVKKNLLGFNSGGSVPGIGDGDTVPAMLTPGEFVINKKAVSKIGLSSLNRLNKSHRVQKFAKGGLVGSLSKIAENPTQAITVLAISASLVNSFGDAEGALSSFTQGLLNVSSKFAITATLFQASQKFLSDNKTVSKYTKTGKEIAARGTDNADITDIVKHNPKVTKFKQDAIQSLASRFEAESDTKLATPTRQNELSDLKDRAIQRAKAKSRRLYLATQRQQPGVPLSTTQKEDIRIKSETTGRRYLERGQDEINKRRAKNFRVHEFEAINSDKYKTATSSFTDKLARSDEFKQERINRVNALNKQSRLKAQKFNTRVAYGAAAGGVVAGFAGDYLSKRANEEIAAGGQSSTKATIGGGLSSAASTAAAGASIGALGGPVGIAIGAAVGGLIGGIKGATDAYSEAEKQIRSIRFDKDLEKFGRKLSELANGTSAASDVSGSINGFISSAFSDISKLQGTEKTDAIAKFKNNASSIEAFYKEIAKNSSSLEEFNRATNNSLIEFAAISDIGFGELVTSVNNTIKSEIKTKEALDKLTAATAATSDTQSVLEAFTTALAIASQSLEGFDRNLDRIEANTSFTGASSKSASAGSIFKAAAGGRFADPNKIGQISSNLLAPFGSVGAKFAKQTGDIAKARQLVPSIVKEFASNALGGDKSPLDLAQKRLGDAGISKDVIDRVLAGFTNTIGNESNQSTLAKKFAADPNGVSNEITKVLTDTIEVMEEFANKVSEHNNRVGRLFEISSKIQAKINEMQLQQYDKVGDLQTRFAEERGNPVSIAQSRARDIGKARFIGGGNSGNVNDLFTRASNAQKNIKKLDDNINLKELNGEVVDNEQKARQENIDTLTKCSTALQKLTEDGYEFAAVERELAKAGNERRFRRDALVNQAFGSRESKLTEAKNIAALISLQAGTTKISQYNDEAKGKILSYAETNKDVSLPGLGGLTPGDVIKQVVTQDQAEKLQRFGGLSPQAALAKAQDNVKQGFEGTKTEDTLRAKLLDVVTAQGVASQALQDLLKKEDPLGTGLLAKENTRFLGELGKILTDKLVNQEKVKIEQADGVLTEARVAGGIPKIEDIQNAISLRSVQDNIDKAREGVLNTKALQDVSIKDTDSRLSVLSKTQAKSTPLSTIVKLSKYNKGLLNELRGKLGINDTDYAEITKQDPISTNPLNTLSAIKRKRDENLYGGLNREIESLSKPIRENREINPLLKGKNSSELQDLLERKQSAPTEAQTRAARSQIDTSNTSIRDLNSDTVARMNNSVQNLNNFASNFQNSIDKMNGMEMSLNGNHKVEVVFNGAETLAGLMPEIEKMVIGRTKEAINKYSELNFPSAQKV